MKTRDEAARAFAEKMDLGRALVGERGDIIFTGDSPLSVDHVPAPDAPLPEQLAFVGRVAVAIGARDVAVSWTRTLFKNRVGFVLSPDPRAPDAKRHERHGYHEGGDLCHAVLLAGLAALEGR